MWSNAALLQEICNFFQWFDPHFMTKEKCLCSVIYSSAVLCDQKALVAVLYNRWKKLWLFLQESCNANDFELSYKTLWGGWQGTKIVVSEIGIHIYVWCRDFKITKVMSNCGDCGIDTQFHYMVNFKRRLHAWWLYMWMALFHVLRHVIMQARPPPHSDNHNK